MPIHHQRLVRRLDPGERVLEVGPGAFAYSRADVLCDRYSRKDPEAYKQDGNLARPVYAQPLIVYSGARMPFVDGAFDYVICSHVLEHVYPEEIHDFIAELTRVAASGYLEFPSYALELLSDVEVHQWLINVVEGEIRLLAKSRARGFVEHVAPTLGPIFGRLGAESPGYQKLYQDYLALWVIGLEWKNHISFRVVDSFDELLDLREQAALIERLAAIERAPQSLISRLPRALKNRLRRLARWIAPGAQAQNGRAGLSGWLSDVTVCPTCEEVGIRFDSVSARCENCGAHYDADDGEYFLYSPVKEIDLHGREAALEDGVD